ncbi:TIGR03619 family F420-dependent LLM class oxidoreductase [[Mycobacterium] kokjensenii]|uniref:TIGR03619 family F420-dependent LLM class oxidoreductase n=1 Tax=[Mycobacterium] kokjensenii TaxID=3064287 RepID=A0ABN9NH20_9MYCO|nr:TIGR03619 family F420-dependent LLM class oxidoreductase [Mycolicibacter sp. MU0083]CAJ1504400.1 TIGR03619 family F420-dependent LLM class oxidoreductase [Mycolicibacter sp. MU0083]
MTHPQISLQLRTFTDDPDHDWGTTLALGAAMDTAGVDRLVVSDHVAFGENPEAYADPRLGGIAGGRQPTGPDGQWLDPVIVLTALAATTTRIRLGTAILLAALRRPTVLAKELATLDVLSGGRLDLGVGVGWQREEYEATGLSFERRGRLLDHTLEVCQTLWTQQRAGYDSPELSFENIHQMPKPVAPGGVPIWVSGTVNDAVARRLARFGTGWIPWGPAMRDPAGAIAAMRDRVTAQGGDPSGMQVLGHATTAKKPDGTLDAAATAASAPALVAAGITDVRVTCSLPKDIGRATDLLSELVEAFHAATR